VDRTGAALLVVAGGAAVAAQAPMTGALAKAVGTWPAALLSFLIGTAALAGVVAVAGGFGSLGEAGGVPWWAFLGGLTGVAIVTTSIVGVPSLGAAGVTAAAIAGQLTASVVIDRLGWFGVDERPVTLAKIAGILFLAIGVWLVVRD
jgi:transporter family-2 protein